MESVVRIADAVSSGRARAADVFAEHVARHRETAGGLNALVQPRHEEGLAEAASLAAASPSDPGAPATAAGRERAGGLLAGVPVSVKDCFPVAGLSTTVGIRSRRGRVDGGDAWIVRRLRAAGAIVVGKSNVPQAMGMHETDNPVWGLTRNPFNAERGPGGSSGGDAALVAAGVVPLGVGSDLAGSIRQPAHACGIAGIVPRSASLGDGGGLDTMPHLAVVRPRVGFLARRVADLGRALSAVGASAAADPAGKGGGRPPLRIAFWDDAGPVGPSAAVRRGVADAVERLRADGLAVERIDGALSVDAAWAHLGILSADGGADLRRLFNGERPMPELARLLRLAGLPRPLRAPLSGLARLLGRSIEADALLATGPRRGPAFDALLALRSDVAARVAAVAAGHDAIVCPVSALPALRHGTAARLVVAAAPCLLANLLDLPAGAVPVTTVRHDEEDGRPASFDPVLRLAAAADRGSRGLPVGVQVVGLDAQPGRGEAVVLEVMRLIERGGVS